MNATTKKKAVEMGEKSSPPSASVCEVGDIVLYAHRPVGLHQNAMLPMIVTRTYEGDTTIDGVVFSADQHLCSNGTGSKPVYQVQMGMSEGTWRPRR